MQRCSCSCFCSICTSFFVLKDWLDDISPLFPVARLWPNFPLFPLPQDGSHIKGLLINFIHHNWPSLLRQSFLEEFITPIVKASKGQSSTSFYSLPEFTEWKQDTPNWHTYKIKYYKVTEETQQ